MRFITAFVVVAFCFSFYLIKVNEPTIYTKQEFIYLEDKKAYFNITLDKPRRVKVTYKNTTCDLGTVDKITFVENNNFGFGNYIVDIDFFYSVKIHIVR